MSDITGKTGDSIAFICQIAERTEIQILQELPGVPLLEDGLNPATWMMQISTPEMEKSMGLDLAAEYRNSHMYR